MSSDRLDFLNRVRIDQKTLQILLSNQDNSCLIPDTNGCLSIINSLESILKLFESTFGTESCQRIIFGHYKFHFFINGSNSTIPNSTLCRMWNLVLSLGDSDPSLFDLRIQAKRHRWKNTQSPFITLV